MSAIIRYSVCSLIDVLFALDYQVGIWLALCHDVLLTGSLQQNRVGSRHGGGGVGMYQLNLERRLVLMIRNSAGASETTVDRRERLRKLALETIDLAKVG